MPSATDEQYRGNLGWKYQYTKRVVPPAAVPWVECLRAEKFQPFINPQDTVVEFGAGLGWNLARLKCGRRVATDLEDFLPRELKERGVEFVASSTTIPSNFASVLICHHVLEHVENPPEMLREAKRILVPSGKLLLHVPFEKERRYRTFHADEPNHHLYAWNVQTLGNLVTACGFNLDRAEIGEFGYDRFAAKVAVKLRLGESGFRLIRRLAHVVTPGCEVRIVATNPPSDP